MYNIPYSVIFTTSVSITTFLLGFLIREWILIYSKNKKLKNTDGFIIWQLENIIRALNNQINGFKDLSNYIISEEYRNRFIEPSLNTDILIEKQEIIHSLIFERKKGKYHKKDEIFNTIISSCHLIKLLIKDSDIQFEQLENKILNYENRLNDIGVSIYTKILELEKKSNKNELEKKMVKMFYELNDGSKRKLSKIHREFIVPVENLLIENNYERMIEFVKLTAVYNKEFEFFITTLKHYDEKAFEYTYTLIEVQKQLKNKVCDYKKLKFKSNLIN